MCAQKNMEDDEIDLTEIVLKLVSLVRNNYLLLLFFLLAGIGISFAIATFSSPRYTRFIIVRLEELSESHFKALVSDLTNLIEEKTSDMDKKKLGDKLHLEPEIVNKIVSLEIIDRLEELKTLKGKNYKSNADNHIFFLEVTVRDFLIIPKLQKSLIQYLNEDEYLKKHIKIKKQLYRNSIKNIDEQISLNNKLKESLTLQRNDINTNTNIMTIDINITGLEKRKQDILWKSFFTRGFELIRGFSDYKNPDYVNKMLYSSLGGFLGAFLGLIVLVFLPSKAGLTNPQKNS